MNIKNIFTIFTCMFFLNIHVHSFVKCYNLNKIYTIHTYSSLKKENSVLLCNKDYNKYSNKKNNNINIINKSKSFLKLMRIKSILPTLLLNLSGGIIINQSIYLFRSKIFIVSCINTILIMCNSMIINDIFDINIDKINNSKRPLITGEVKYREAVILSIILFILTKYLSVLYLPNNLCNIIDIATLFTIIYTPILKKIVFLKNISCAIVVSFAIFFSGLSANSLNYIQMNKNYNILLFLTKFIFLGSLYNELLLDIHDYEGDKKNKINTIPVLFGKDNTFKIANVILKINIVQSVYSIYRIFNFKFILQVIPIIIFNNINNDLINIKKYDYSKEKIDYAINNLNKPLFIMISYICILSFFK